MAKSVHLLALHCNIYNNHNCIYLAEVLNLFRYVSLNVPYQQLIIERVKLDEWKKLYWLWVLVNWLVLLTDPPQRLQADTKHVCSLPTMSCSQNLSAHSPQCHFFKTHLLTPLNVIFSKYMCSLPSVSVLNTHLLTPHDIIFFKTRLLTPHNIIFSKHICSLPSMSFSQNTSAYSSKCNFLKIYVLTPVSVCSQHASAHSPRYHFFQNTSAYSPQYNFLKTHLLTPLNVIFSKHICLLL